MAFTRLHDAIIHSLEIAKRPLSYKELADFIENDSLWKRPSDNEFPPPAQIRLRVNSKHYRNLFEVDPHDRVSLSGERTENELRIARLTYNTNNWKFPSGYAGKSKTKSYEKSNGFGHEEWLLDLHKLIDGYHYSFLEPVNKHHKKYIGSRYDFLLFTVNSMTKERFWIGKIKNGEVIDGALSQKIKAEYQKRGWYSEMKQELDNLNLGSFKLDEWNGLSLFNIRFKPEDFIPFSPNTLIDAKDDALITTYHYTLMYAANEPEILQRQEEGFVLGNCSLTARHSKTMLSKKYTEKLVEHPFVHHEISRQLEKELQKSFDEVYCENKTGTGCQIDLVSRKGDDLYFYEIKTYNDAKTCIRVALGQIVEYAYFPQRKLAKRLYIVTPHRLNKDLQAYIMHLRENVKLPVYYIAYSLEQKAIVQEI